MKQKAQIKVDRKALLSYPTVKLSLDVRAYNWSKAEAKRRGVGYQTIINETILKQAA